MPAPRAHLDRIEAGGAVAGADVINGALTGKVPGPDLRIDRTFLTLATVYILVPSLIIVASLLLHAKVNRVINIIVSVLYLISIVVTVLGESWTYHILGSAVEIAPTLRWMTPRACRRN